MIALVTGGNRGIGLAIAQALVHGGHTVYLAARHLDRLRETWPAYPAQAIPLSMDVTQSETISQAVGQIATHHQRLDILVNAAGVAGIGAIEDTHDEAQWHHILATDLTGTYLCCRAVLPFMRQHQWGRILNIASVLGLRGMRQSHAYCAAKHGVVGLTRALAQDVMSDGITVNALCPGWVDTDMGHESMATIAHAHGIEPQMFKEAELAAVPLQRWITPQEVAALAIYLVSEAAAPITGQAIEMSGGL